MAEVAATSKTAERPNERPEPGEQEKALVADLWKRIKAARKKQETRFKNYEQFRNYTAGMTSNVAAAAGNSPMDGLVRTNLIFSTISTMLPQVYARNPDISVSPSEGVPPAQYKVFKKFSKTLECVVSRVLVKDGFLKKRMKQAVQAAMICEIGWVKLSFQESSVEDPLIKARISDIQDNLKNLDSLRQELLSDGKDPDLLKAKLEEQVKSLEAKVEVSVAEGIVLDKLLSEHMLILDDSITEFHSIDQAGALAQELWFTEDQYKTALGYAPSSGATRYQEPKAGAATGTTSADNTTCFYRVYEVWSRTDNRRYTLCEGELGFCRPPVTPTRVGERWYPYFPLGFNFIDGRLYPLSDVVLIKNLQDEYEVTRSNFAEHRRLNVPVRVVRKGGSLTPADIEKIQNRRTGEVLVVSGDPGKPLRDDMGVLENPAIDPMLYDTTPIRADIELVTGSSDAVRGNVLKAKTATEAEIMREGLMSRVSERQDAIEDVIGEMAQYSAEGLLQRLTKEQVIRIAGPEAVWPVMSIEQVFDLVNIEIKAGSSGKPNKMREREQWLQLMPTIEKAMERIMLLRQNGMNDMADAVTELVRETLVRFDERIDVDAFIPPAHERQGGDMAQQAMTQLPQLQEQVQMLTQELEKAQGLLADRSLEERKVTQTETIANADRSAADARENNAVVARKDADVHRANVEADAKVQIEEVRAASEERIAQINADALVESRRIEAEAKAAAELAKAKPEGEGDQRLAQVLEELKAMIKALETGMGALAKAAVADRVPQRGKDGKVERVRVQV